jgi:ribonuclease J
VLRDRKHLGQDGIFIIVVTVDRGSGQLIGQPDVVTRGFVHEGAADDLIEGATSEVVQAMAKWHGEKVEAALFQNNLKDILGKYFYTKTKRRPMVIPVVVEV